jgi:hypothetical protein
MELGLDSFRGSVLVASIALIVVACARPSQGVAPDRDLVTLLHTLIVGAVSGGGRTQDDVFIPADSTSASIMRLAEVPIHAPTKLNCPGGTEANGDVVRGTLGYVVDVSVKGEGDTRIISLTKSCSFMYRGNEDGFMQGSDFEIKREHGHWRISRQMDQFIT